MLLKVPDEYASSVKSMLLYAGLPREDEVPGIEQFKKAGGNVIFFLSPEEKGKYTLKPDEAGVTWENDTLLKKWLFENMHLWTGGQIGGSSPEKAQQFAGVLGEVVNLTNFDTQSVTFLAKDNEPAKNMYRNFRWVDDGVPLRRAKGLGKGQTAVIVAAGPSLNDQWTDLVRIQREVENTTWIVCGRSYAKAAESGIVPDFVVEVEQFDWDDKIFMFAPKPGPFTTLCGPLTACPGLFTAWPSLKMMLVDHNVAKLFGWEIGTDSIDGGNSILHHMFNLAMFLGCERVCLAGADLAYPPGSKDTHADGTFPAWPRQVLVQEHNRQTPLELVSTDGGKVQSSQPYRNFGLFLEMQIATHRKAKPALDVINFSAHGQKIEGTHYEDVKTWNGLQRLSLSASASSAELGSSPQESPSTSSSSEPTASVSSPTASEPTTEAAPKPSSSEPTKSDPLISQPTSRKSKTIGRTRKASPGYTPKTGN